MKNQNPVEERRRWLLICYVSLWWSQDSSSIYFVNEAIFFSFIWESNGSKLNINIIRNASTCRNIFRNMAPKIVAEYRVLELALLDMRNRKLAFLVAAEQIQKKIISWNRHIITIVSYEKYKNIYKWEMNQSWEKE